MRLKENNFRSPSFTEDILYEEHFIECEVKITGNSNGHNFKKGQKVIATGYIYKSTKSRICIDLNNDWWWYVVQDEYEVVSKPKPKAKLKSVNEILSLLPSPGTKIIITCNSNSHGFNIGDIVQCTYNRKLSSGNPNIPIVLCTDNTGDNKWWVAYGDYELYTEYETEIYRFKTYDELAVEYGPYTSKWTCSSWNSEGLMNYLLGTQISKSMYDKVMNSMDGRECVSVGRESWIISKEVLTTGPAPYSSSPIVHPDPKFKQESSNPCSEIQLSPVVEIVLEYKPEKPSPTNNYKILEVQPIIK